MDALIGLAGFIGMIVSAIALIIKAIKKKPTKNTLIALAICFVLFVIALNMSPSRGSSSTPTPTKTPTPTETPAPTETPETVTKTDWLKRYSDVGIDIITVPADILYKNGSFYVGQTVLTFFTVADSGSDSLKANTDNNESFSYSIVATFKNRDEFNSFVKGDMVYVVGKVKPMNSISLLGGDKTVQLEDCHVLIHEITEEEIEATRDTSIELKENASEVFFYDLVHSPADYLKKYIEVSFPIYSIYSNGDIKSEKISDYEIEAKTGDDSLYNNKNNYKFTTIRGYISEIKYNTIDISDIDIVYIGPDAPPQYTNQLITYTEQVRQGKIEARAEFISSAQHVDYNELARYPDSYKNQPLEMRVSIIEVESDGWLLNGAIDARYDGGEIVIHDEREVKEPRLKAGDNLTIYATGAGLATIKTYAKGTGILGSDIGADVVDSYEVPCVTMIYTELDRLSSFGLSDSYRNDDDYYANLGRQAGEKFNDWVAGTR